MKRIVVLLAFCFTLFILSACGDMGTASTYLMTGKVTKPSDQNAFSFSFAGFSPSDTSSQESLGPATGTSIVGGPSLSADFINHVLANAGSPASGLGDVFYSTSTKYGIDDTYALAFFKHESTFGLYGEAALSKSIGNLRCLGADYADLGTWCQDNFAWFPSWGNGIEGWNRLMKNLYVDQWGCSTVESVIPHYAPASDHNNEAAYAYSVEHDVNAWRGNQ